MNANATSPIHGACHICAAGRMAMNAIEIPASEPSIAARGVHRRIHGPTSAPQQHDHADDEGPGEPGLPGLDRVTRAQLHRQHHHEDDDEHVRHRRAVGQRGHVRPALAPGQPAGQDRVPDVAQRQRDGQGRQDPAVHGVVGQADDAQAEPGDHDHVEQHVGAEPEQTIPVAGGPPGQSRRLGAAGRSSTGHPRPPILIASSSAALSATHPTMPPWALIICSAA